MIRTQDEVDALWLDKQSYVFVAQVTVPGAVNIREAAQTLQTLYEGCEAISGEFNVEPEEPNAMGEHNMFLVMFFRDITNDADVVNDALLAGHDFESVLRSQFEQEFTASAKHNHLHSKLVFLGLPTFIL